MAVLVPSMFIYRETKPKYEKLIYISTQWISGLLFRWGTLGTKNPTVFKKNNKSVRHTVLVVCIKVKL